MKNTRTKFGIGILLFFSLISTAAVARQGNTAPPKKTNATNTGHIGQFHLVSEGGEVSFESSDKTKTEQIDIVGKSITVTSENYDMTAQKITLQRDKRISKVTSAKATNNVRITIRNEDQNIVLTCDTATYYYATADKPTHINVDGNVRAVIRNKSFTADEPLVLTGDSGVVEMPDKETTRVRLKNPTATGRPIEPETKKPAAKTPQ